MPLVFNSEMMFRDMVDEALVPAAQEAMDKLVDDFESNEDKFNREGKDYKVEDAVYADAEKYIKSTCTFYALAIMNSFGRGTGIVDDNEDLADYMENQMLWNPLRSKGSKKIVGRPMDNTYIDIVTGEQKTSTGLYAGKKVWGSASWDWEANYAIQNAVKRMKNSLDRILERNVNEFLENMPMGKYFDDSNV